MTNCMMCNKPLGLADNNGHRHEICYEAFLKRIENKICGQCGEKPIWERVDRYCVDCNGSSPFKYYNGPS